MTLGFPRPLSFQSSNVVDEVPTLDELITGCHRPTFSEGFELKSDMWIWEYTRTDEFTPQIYDANSSYKIGDVVWKDCKVQRIVGVKGTTSTPKAKEPEMYGAWDENMDQRTWKQRYFRIKSNTKSGWLTKQWRVGARWYYMFWEDRGYGGCGKGGWRWSAKDLNASGVRHHTQYLRTCLMKNYATKYAAGKDVKARIHNWRRSGCKTAEPTIQFQSMIERNGYFYFRTHLNKPVEYYTTSTTTYTLEVVKSPADIKGFRQRRMVNAMNPFDGKNYTLAVVNTESTGGYAQWTLMSAGEFDSIAFGRVLCDKINLRFEDSTGNSLGAITNYEIDNSLEHSSDMEHYATNIVYMDKLMPEETIITIEIWGSEISIGEILAAETIDAGFTKVAFKNKFKDFSPKEQDQWGNIVYRDGVRVHVHSGVVEFPIMRYDQLNRLMMKIGGRKMVINSSDSRHNRAPDGINIFEATMLIGRFTNIDLDSSEKNKRIGDLGRYNFNIEEVV